MNRALTIFFFATVFCLTSIGVFAQNVTYLDADYKPATAANYTYKRVIKYKEPIVNVTLGENYYGNITANSQPSGLHVCTLIDYYKTGEIALVGNRTAGNINCSQLGGFNGQVIAYYKDGTIKRKEPWQYGKLNGVVIYYDVEGNETKRVEYVNGKLIEEGRFSAPSDSPLLGTWKYIEYYDFGVRGIDVAPTVKISATVTYYQNGILETDFQNAAAITTKEKRNWKYISKSNSSGVSEEYQGDELMERGTIRWINKNQFEYTVTFHTNTDAIGNKSVWTRQ